MPKVSVIIPNYNHAPFLRQRIDSVLEQTFTDFEVILLDDCSTDNSVQILEEYAQKHSHVTFYPNTKNTGSTFAQWNKGVQLAKGDYVWIAESDDFCAPNLLETLVPLLDENPNVGLAFAQSFIVDERGKKINNFIENYKFIYDDFERWQSDFIVNGQKECTDYLIFSNTIPNASGALMRKSVYQNCGGAETGWRLNGDWFFYIKMLLQSDLAFSAKPLNYFRQHQQTQRYKAKTNHVVFDEIIYTLEFVENNAPVDPAKMQQAYKNVAGWWGGSLSRQQFSRMYVKENYRLFRYFRKKRPRLALNIISNACFNLLHDLLVFLHLKKPIKKIRAKLFPGKYFDY